MFDVMLFALKVLLMITEKDQVLKPYVYCMAN